MITKSMGVVFVDCDKCNESCSLQQELTKQKYKARINAPFGDLKEYTIRSKCINMEQITQNTQKIYELVCKICYNCKEKQR